MQSCTGDNIKAEEERPRDAAGFPEASILSIHCNKGPFIIYDRGWRNWRGGANFLTEHLGWGIKTDTKLGGGGVLKYLDTPSALA